ncbi:MAG: dienelactone hydrolase family protein [Burkholderiales bacterium]|nr:dienelactone hydrolase family protein [Burkholderiales bacterium]
MKGLALLGWLACTLAQAAPQAVEVPSLDRRDGVALRQPGFWFPATVAGPAPAMLLLHGCGGPYDSRGRLSRRMLEYAELLNAQGLHVLVADSLTPRGEKELCTQRLKQRAVTQANRRRDALGALQWLAAQPGVDAARLGLMGWSHGGSAVLAATQRDQAEVMTAPVRPAFAVAFYPGCSEPLKQGWQPVAPLLLLLGAEDDWTPAAPCEALAAQARAPGVQLATYAGAYHGFDGTAPLVLRTDVPNGVRPGQGVHVGGQPAARAASRERLLQFLHQQLGAR